MFRHNADSCLEWGTFLILEWFIQSVLVSGWTKKNIPQKHLGYVYNKSSALVKHMDWATKWVQKNQSVSKENCWNRQKD